MIIGIDPGLQGAIAVMSEAGVSALLPFPNEPAELALIIRQYPVLNLKVFHEKAIYVPRSRSVTGLFRTAGRIEGVCAALCVSCTEVPITGKDGMGWKDNILFGFGWQKNKGASVLYVTKKYPSLAKQIYDKTVFKDKTGPADAICIAEYGMNKYKG